MYTLIKREEKSFRSRRPGENSRRNSQRVRSPAEETGWRPNMEGRVHVAAQAARGPQTLPTSNANVNVNSRFIQQSL